MRYRINAPALLAALACTALVCAPIVALTWYYMVEVFGS